MIQRIQYIILLFVFAISSSCNNVNKETQQPATTIYPEAAAKDFIVNSIRNSQTVSILKLDTILKTVADDSNTFRQTVALLTRPLSDPNSAYRNENLYIKLLQSQLESPWYIDAEKTALQNKLTLIMQNRVANPANDFTYLMPKGSTKKMYDIKADHLLLFFYNPECEACKETKAALMTSAVITEKIKSGKLKILAVYTDKGESVWRKHLPEMPRQWIQGRDEDEYLWKNKVYNLKAIPTVYLLDKDKKVVLKDCMAVGMIEEKLRGG